MPSSDADDTLTNSITSAMQRGVDRARALAGALAQPLVIWRDGGVQHVDPVTLRPVTWPTHVRDGDELRPPSP